MGSAKNNEQGTSSATDKAVTKLTCGIVMPIAAMGDYSASHWVDVQNIIKEAVALAGYDARLVSESKDSTVIPKSIVQNLYDDDIVVCDVSGKNPNVMFELGMRLAFDKPVVLIKDVPTGYSFDTSTIEHLEYPRDLRYSEIQIFKQRLAEKIRATYEAASKEGYRSFLSNFATIKVAHLEQTTLSESQVLERILTKLDTLEVKVNTQRSILNPQAHSYKLLYREQIIFQSVDQEYNELLTTAKRLYGEIVKVRKTKDSFIEIFVSMALDSEEQDEVLATLKPLAERLVDLPF